MANTIQIKRGSGTPTTSNLAEYELGYDYAANKLYIHDDAENDIIEISGTDTNTTYTAGTNLTLDGTEFDVDDAFLKNDASDTMSGSLTVTGVVHVQSGDDFALGEIADTLRMKGNSTNSFNFLNNGNGWAHLNCGNVVAAGSVSIGGHAVDDIDIGSEFVDADDHLMTSGAIKEKIESYSYLTAAPITALNNATANELVTVGATTTELDAEQYLTYGSSVLEVRQQVKVTDGTRDIRLNSNHGSKAAVGTVGAHDFNFFTANTIRATVDSGGNFGIGTESPGALLTVYKDGTQASSVSTSYQIQTVSNSNGGIAIQAGDSSKGLLVFGDNGNYAAGQIEYYNSSHDMAFSTNETEALRIDSSQNVGIGATDPLRKLHVVGSMAVNEGTGQYYGILMAGGESNDPRITIGDWHNSSGSIMWDSSDNVLRIDSQHSTANRDIVFSGNDFATEYMRVNATGLGIGTNSPDSPLHIGNNVMTSAGLDSFADYQILLYDTGTSTTSYGMGIRGGTFVFNSDDDYEWRRDNSVKMFLDGSDGRLGIGMTPDRPLNVNRSGDGNVARFSHSGSTGSVDIYSAAAGGLINVRNGSGTSILELDGRSTAGASKLGAAVATTIAATGAITANNGKPVLTESGSWIGDLGSNGYTKAFTYDVSSCAYAWVTKGGQMSTLLDGSYFAYESNSTGGGGFWSSYDSSYGNACGIKASGTSELSVKQIDGGACNLKVPSGLFTVNSTSAYQATVQYDASTRLRISVEDSGRTRFYTDNSANVGIESGGLYVQPTNKIFLDGGLDTWLNEPTGNTIGFGAGGGERMRMTTTGLGIGTASPATKLHIDASQMNPGSTSALPVVRIAGSYGGGLGFLDTKESGIYQVDNGDTWNFYCGRTIGSDTALSKVALTMKSDGKVGIGDTSPSYKLDVTGDARFTADIRSEGRLMGQNGSASAPAYSFTSQGNAGMYRYGTGIGFTAAGTERVRIESDKLYITGAGVNTFRIQFPNDQRIYDNGSGGLKIGAASHELQMYSGGPDPIQFYTGGISGTERMRINSSGCIKVGPNGGDTAHTFEIDTSGNANHGLFINADEARGAGDYALYIDDEDPNSRGTIVVENASGTGMKITTQGSNYLLDLVSNNDGSNPARSCGVRMTSYEGRANGFYHQDANSSGHIWFSGNRYAGSTADWQVGYSSSGDTADYLSKARILVDRDGNFHANEDVIAYSSTIGSDIKLKKNVEDIGYGLDDVLKMRAVEFDWKEKRQGKHDIGVIAQELEKIIPEVVNEVKTIGEGAENDDTHKVVDYAKLTSVLIKAIQQQQEEIELLKANYDDLKYNRR